MASVEQLIRAWVEMWNACDLDQVDRLFVNDARVTYFSSERDGVVAGLEALRNHHRDFGFVPGGADRGTSLWVDGLHAADFGAAIVVSGTWHSRRGSNAEQYGPVTFVCVAAEGGYRFAHMHFARALACR